VAGEATEVETGRQVKAGIRHNDPAMSRTSSGRRQMPSSKSSIETPAFADMVVARRFEGPLPGGRLHDIWYLVNKNINILWKSVYRRARCLKKDGG
jgi:hypothetical protein